MSQPISVQDNETPTAINVHRSIMRAFVEFRHMAATLSLPSTNADVAQLRKDFEELKLDIEDILRDQNDINESTRAQLDAISTALTELQSKEPRKRERRPIGFIMPDEKNKWNSICPRVRSPLFFLKTSKKWGISCRCREKFITLQAITLLTHAYDAQYDTEL